MNLQQPQSVIEELQEYAPLYGDLFYRASDLFLTLKKRKSFDLHIQQGLHTLLELHADVTTISAFLLFQVPASHRKEHDFGENVEKLLSSLEGLREITAFGNVKIEQSTESVRKMLLAMSKDLRVVLVLVALRYAELFELDRHSPDLRKRIARQTLDIYVPICGRLGIYTLKRKLEDRCFSYLSSTDYSALVQAFAERPELQNKTIEKLVESVSHYLKKEGIDAEVSGRVKGIYSTYMKLKRKGGGGIDEIHDLLALRVVVSKEADCYTALSVLNSKWQPITGRFKDYIAMPKVNGYRSLHSTLLGMIEDSMRSVELQIRTQEMHREAEFGIAAHWWYEEQGIKKQTNEQFVGRSDYQERLKWVKNLVYFQEKEATNKDFDFFTDRIFVMTLNGRVIELPKGATPLDFAYSLSETLGHHCSQAKVNGKVVPLDYELKNGDRVFVVKKMETTPNLYWLSLVHTEHAKNAIRQWLVDQGEESLLDHGTRLLNSRLKHYNQPSLDEHLGILQYFQGKNLNLQQREQLLIEVGQGKKDADDVIRDCLSQEVLFQHERVAVSPVSRKGSSGVEVGGEQDFAVKLAACCHPNRGEDIIGYVTRGGFISVHNRSCKVLASLDEQRLISANWTGQKVYSRNVRIAVDTELTNVLIPLSHRLKQRGVQLRGFTHHQMDAGMHQLVFDLHFKKENDLGEVIDAWKNVRGVTTVKQL